MGSVNLIDPAFFVDGSVTALITTATLRFVGARKDSHTSILVGEEGFTHAHHSRTRICTGNGIDEEVNKHELQIEFLHYDRSLNRAIDRHPANLGIVWKR